MYISRGSFLLAILVLAATYLFGGYSGRHDLFPYSILRALKASPTAPDRYTFDQPGRLESDDQKKAVVCPQQTDRTAVLLLIGQSNAGNHGGQRFRSEHGDAVVNFFDGNAMSPRRPCWGPMASAENIGPSSATFCWIADRSTGSCWLPRP